MKKTSLTLSGLAIMGVIINHSNWHVLRQFPNGDTQGYPFLVIDQLGKFAVATFIFIAGSFIAYATSGGKRDSLWAIIRPRLKSLMWPWLIWSVIFWVGQYFQGSSLSLNNLWCTLFIQYYFVPLLMFYYLLAPMIIKEVKSNPIRLLIWVSVIQLLSMVLFYARIYWPNFPEVLKPWVDMGPLSYLRFAFYFPFGIVCRLFADRVKWRFDRFRILLPWLTLLLFFLSVGEAAIAYSIGGEVWPRGNDQTKLTSVLFSISLFLCFAIFDTLTVPLNRFVNQLGARSYGLYLCHYLVVGIIAKILTHVSPWLTSASQGWLFVPILFLLSLVLSNGLMENVAHLPRIKQFYRYVFG